MGPAAYRLDVDRMVGCDLDDEEDFKECEDVFAHFWDKKLAEPPSCGAGIFAFNIDPYGNASPCTMFTSFRHSVKELPFVTAWQRVVGEYDRAKRDFTPLECRSCSMFFMCPQCPAWAETEGQRMNTRIDYLCSYAKTLEKKFLAKKEERSHEKTAI